MPDTMTTDESSTGPLNGVDNEFLVNILTANANWSASIHNAALDGQEHASNEWAARYALLAARIELLLDSTDRWEEETVLYARLGVIASEQGFWPSSASEQVARYRERLDERKAAGEKVRSFEPFML